MNQKSKATLQTLMILAASGVAMTHAQAAKLPGRSSSVTFSCPKGSLQKGALPPKGYEAWCEKRVQLKGKEKIFDSVKHGPHFTYYRTGQIWKREYYKLGEKHGRATTYWVSGKKQEERIYREGKATGAFAIYRLDGNVWQRGNFLDGKRNGKVAYYESNDRIPIVCGIRKGTPTLCLSRYQNGKTKFQLKFSNGLANGNEVLFYPNGKIFAKRSHSNGFPLGNANLFHANGKVGLEVACQRGKMTSAPKEWNADGKPIRPRLSERIASSLCAPVAQDAARLSETSLVHYFPTLKQ